MFKVKVCHVSTNANTNNDGTGHDKYLNFCSKKAKLKEKP